MRSIIVPILFFTLQVFSQNTISHPISSTPPKVTIEAVSFMQGHWRGEAFGGITEEIWAPPLGGSMMFCFKLVVNGNVSFYELGHIRELDGSLIYELKHFNADMTAWEEKEEVQQFKLVKVEKDKVFFEGFTFERVGENEVVIYALIDGEKDKPKEVTFNFKRL
ncbi:DUF6265 family protein [Cytophaga sp. FL35]|uniref:DUF6265 family protein n=1 Tax=Cytophaga sp. FL35 TaxID=1904456 RepID=UPI0016535BD2|nr:DUF6265 family protein [Cytophaga sp. FL35]MBC6997288.1 hypothetical protein [Cytophaga sp. FL35]